MTDRLSDEAGVTWLIVDQPPGRKLAEWKRRVAVTDDMEIFVAAIAFRKDETALFFCASFDRVRVIFQDGHPYYPLSYAVREDPAMSESAEVIRRRVLEAMEGSTR